MSGGIYPLLQSPLIHDSCPGGESAEEMTKRVDAVIDKVLSSVPMMTK